MARNERNDLYEEECGRAEIPLRGLVLRHRNHRAGERAVGLSQLIQNRKVIGVDDRYQVAFGGGAQTKLGGCDEAILCSSHRQLSKGSCWV